MKRLLAAFIFLAVISAASTSLAAVSADRLFQLVEERSYSDVGRAEARALMRVRATAGTDGVTTTTFSSEGAYAYDTIGGALAVPNTPQTLAILRTTPDRKSVSGVAATAVINANASDVRSGAGLCTNWSGTAVLDLAGLVPGATTALARISVTRRDRVCEVSWEVEALTVKSPTGEGDLQLRLSGAAISTHEFEPLGTYVAYENIAGVGLPFRGGRAIVLIEENGGRTSSQELADWGEAIAGLVPPVETASFRVKPNASLKAAHGSLASLHAAGVAGIVEAAALAYAEQKANPLPLLAIVGTAFVVDNLSTLITNAAGAGVLITGAALGNQTMMDVGQDMVDYPGLGGWLAGRSFGSVASLLGGSTTTVQRADDVGRLVYSGFAAFTPAGVGGALNRGFSQAALQHLLLRTNIATGQIDWLGRSMLSFASHQSGFLDALQLSAQGHKMLLDWAFEEDSARQNGQVALDLIGARGASGVSPTPSARTDMAGLQAISGDFDAIADPRSPFVTSTTGDISGSTGGLSDVVISGLLTFRLFDHATEDGDIVSLLVTSNGSTVLGQTVNLTNAGALYGAPGAGEGLAVISITALNEGAFSPNTGAVSVTSPVVSGSGSQLYRLSTGQTGLLRVLILGRRARGGP